MTSISPAVVSELEQVGVAVAPELPALLGFASKIPGLSFLGVFAQLLPALLPALKATGGDVQAVVDHLDPTKPADPRLEKE